MLASVLTDIVDTGEVDVVNVNCGLVKNVGIRKDAFSVKEVDGDTVGDNADI